jgi:hypothetical protein
VAKQPIRAIALLLTSTVSPAKLCKTHLQAIRANSTTITTVNDPIDPLPPRSEPAHTQHVGSISTAYGALRRRRSSQCPQQNSFGTTPGNPLQPDSSRELQQSICRLIVLSKAFNIPIDMMADELDDIARSFDIELHYRGSSFFLEEQCSPHRRHCFRSRIDRLVLADVWPQCRRHDTSRRRVSEPRMQLRGYLAWRSGYEKALTAWNHSLHPTQYPWEHAKWHKTFDHMA